MSRRVFVARTGLVLRFVDAVADKGFANFFASSTISSTCGKPPVSPNTNSQRETDALCAAISLRKARTTSVNRHYKRQRLT